MLVLDKIHDEEKAEPSVISCVKQIRAACPFKIGFRYERYDVFIKYVYKK